MQDPFAAAGAAAGPAQPSLSGLSDWSMSPSPRRSRSPRSALDDVAAGSAAPSDQRRAVAGPAEPRRAVQGPTMVGPRLPHGKHRSVGVATLLRARRYEEEEEENNEEEEGAGPPYPWLADADTLVRLPDAGTVAEPRARLPDVYRTRPWALSLLYQTDAGRAGMLPGPGQSLEGPINANERALSLSGLCGKSGRVVVQCGRCDACLADAAAGPVHGYAGTVAEPRELPPHVPWTLSSWYQADSGRAGILPGPGQSLEGPLNASERALVHSGLCGKSGRIVRECGRCDACRDASLHASHPPSR